MSKNLIEAVEKDIYQEIDGFYVFGTSNGCLYAHQLREIADELDCRNAPWQLIIDEERFINSDE